MKSTTAPPSHRLLLFAGKGWHQFYHVLETFISYSNVLPSAPMCTTFTPSAGQYLVAPKAELGLFWAYTPNYGYYAATTSFYTEDRRKAGK